MTPRGFLIQGLWRNNVLVYQSTSSTQDHSLVYYDLESLEWLHNFHLLYYLYVMSTQNHTFHFLPPDQFDLFSIINLFPYATFYWASNMHIPDHHDSVRKLLNMETKPYK